MLQILWSMADTFNRVDFRYDVVTSFYDVRKPNYPNA